MHVHDVDQLLRSLVTLEDYGPDGIVFGDGLKEVRRIGVAWLPYTSIVEKAAAEGVDLLVVHEPAFYHAEEQAVAQLTKAAEAKKRLLDQYGIAIVRSHNVWDALDGVGIPFAWAKHLELAKPIRVDRYFQIHEIPQQTAKHFAQHVARRTAVLGQDRVIFSGDPSAVVRSVGIGTGCISDCFTLYDKGADIVVTVDDIVCSWVNTAWSKDTGVPLIVVNHAVSEEPGMDTLADCLSRRLPGIEVVRFACGYPYQVI